MKSINWWCWSTKAPAALYLAVNYNVRHASFFNPFAWTQNWKRMGGGIHTDDDGRIAILVAQWNWIEMKFKFLLKAHNCLGKIDLIEEQELIWLKRRVSIDQLRLHDVRDIGGTSSQAILEAAMCPIYHPYFAIILHLSLNNFAFFFCLFLYLCIMYIPLLDKRSNYVCFIVLPCSIKQYTV